MIQSLLIEQRAISIAPGYFGSPVFSLQSIPRLFHAFSNGPTRADNAQGNAKNSPHRILIVDDEKDITMVFKPTLERAGFNVEVFNDPIEALSEFEAGQYDIILLDIRMPQMTGLELFQEIRKKDSQTKVWFISAFDVYSDEIRKYSIEDQEIRMIRKPISTRDLVRIIKEDLKAK